MREAIELKIIYHRLSAVRVSKFTSAHKGITLESIYVPGVCPNRYVLGHFSSIHAKEAVNAVAFKPKINPLFGNTLRWIS